ncbi:vicilin-like seed storage protein At2g18540, partial [Bombus pyrosoma]|uniref:vicilin-like seed storage protein At2g18540 n=1 Tax=Bombus pyrosoma TaxID=396416 RepID=UPI001CB90BFE
MFEALVESVALFGAEVWGWNIEERLDRIKRGYVKWILGLDRTIPNYILTEECKLEEIKEKALKRATRERNWGNGQEDKRARKRKKKLEEVKSGGTQREAGEEQESWTGDQIVEERRKREIEERRKRIREFRYNIYYRNINIDEMPKYLEGKMKWKDRKIIARFRYGSETKAKEHWKEEEEKRCRLCGREEEDLRHVIEECEITGGLKDMEKTLNENGEGLTELKAIIEKR